jgi:hypothetical protein
VLEKSQKNEFLEPTFIYGAKDLKICGKFVVK